MLRGRKFKTFMDHQRAELVIWPKRCAYSNELIWFDYMHMVTVRTETRYATSTGMPMEDNDINITNSYQVTYVSIDSYVHLSSNQLFDKVIPADDLP